MVKECKPVSEVVGPELASPMADTFEAIIRGHYCASKGGCQFWPNGQPGNEDFADRREGLSNVIQFLLFLKKQHPELPDTAFPGAIPDLVTQSFHREEFYEIKPNSRTGVEEGRTKVFMLQGFFGIHDLDYIAGMQYRPNEEIFLYRESAGILDITVNLHYFWEQPGLIVYELCTEAKVRVPEVEIDPEVQKTLENIMWMILLLILIFFGLRYLPKGPVPAPTPVLPTVPLSPIT